MVTVTAVILALSCPEVSQTRIPSLRPHWASFSSSLEWAQDRVLTEDGPRRGLGMWLLPPLPLPREWRGQWVKRVKFLKVKVKSLSRVRLFVTPWTVASQAPPAMGFSRQECWSGLPFPSPGDLPNPGIEPGMAAVTICSDFGAQKNKV